ncbi:MAG: CBS domain-containing protein [Gammaproteobacteria bacterium]
MFQVRHVLARKGDLVFQVDPTETVYRALEILAEHDVGALAVVDENRLVGIFSERDYARKVVLHGLTSRNTVVRELMSLDPVTITPDTPIEACMVLMTERRIRHLPVLSEGRLAGLVSIGDIVKMLMAEREGLIEELREYIGGKT